MIAAMTVLVLMTGQPSFIQASGDVAAGKRIYLELCKACHGPDGKGPGVMKFSPPAADLTSREVQTKLDSRLYNSIHEGRANTAMGAWKHSLSPKEVLDVLTYVRTFGGGSVKP
jgi:mono/diheme cytochrome c family protein